MKSRRELFKNCIIHGKNREFLVHIISEHPQKTISLMFETETLGPCLVRKLKCVCRGGGGGVWPPCSPNGYTPLKGIFVKIK